MRNIGPEEIRQHILNKLNNNYVGIYAYDLHYALCNTYYFIDEEWNAAEQILNESEHLQKFCDGETLEEEDIKKIRKELKGE